MVSSGQLVGGTVGEYWEEERRLIERVPATEGEGEGCARPPLPAGREEGEEGRREEGRGEGERGSERK
eukprot:37939-Rhodomonas_salina.1